jgi:hypothetical protein
VVVVGVSTTLSVSNDVKINKRERNWIGEEAIT